MRFLFTILFGSMVMLTACKQQQQSEFDATGTFEAVETIVSAEANGKILQLDLVEGQELQAGQFIGYIDSMPLHLERMLLLQNKKAILSAKPVVNIQLEALQQELSSLQLDKARIENMVKANVSSPKQLDDLLAKETVLKARIAAQQSSLQTTVSNIGEQGNNVFAQLAILNNRIAKCNIVNPVTGTVLSKYAEHFEMASAGKPLYKIADISSLILRAFVSQTQLNQIKLGQEVKVFVDNGRKDYKAYSGKVSWIADKAEFTPKTIQTKEERANLVYAIKLIVPNDGLLKIGQYGQVKWTL